VQCSAFLEEQGDTTAETSKPKNTCEKTNHKHFGTDSLGLQFVFRWLLWCR